jgi:hypothetical protein
MVQCSGGWLQESEVRMKGFFGGVTATRLTESSSLRSTSAAVAGRPARCKKYGDAKNLPLACENSGMLRCWSESKPRNAPD